MTKKEKCQLIEGGWIGDDKQQNFAIVKYDIHRKVEHHFNFKGIGKYKKHNEKELHKLTDFINNLLEENKQLKDEKNIRNALENMWMICDDKSNKIFIQSYSIKPECGGNFNL